MVSNKNKYFLLVIFLAAVLPQTLAEVCKDTHERCKYWATNKDYCDGPFKWWMVKNCKDSCGQCHQECRPEFTIEGYSYAVSGSKMSYTAAQAHCASRGGQLAHSDMHSMEVRRMLSEKLNFRNYQSFWIGLDKLGDGARWKWADGTVAEKSGIRWTAFAPKTRDDNDCAYIYRSDKLTHKNLRTDNWYECDKASSFALCQFDCDNQCSLEFTAARDWSTISSPNDPNLFYYFPNCEWAIESSSGYSNIALEILDFPTLPGDRVAIHDGDTLLAELSGLPQAQQRFVVGTHATLKFTSPHWHARQFTIRYKGFKQCDDNPCLNDGVCALGDVYGDTSAKYTCQCPRNFTGSICEIAVPPEAL